MERERRGRRPIASLTESQRRALLEVQAFVGRHRFPPTVQELAEILGISGASAHAQIGQLIRKGYIKREPRKARGLSVLREPEDTPVDLVPVPLVGTVVAGHPVLAEENVIGEVLVEERLALAGRCFALRVTGDSMTNAGIADRDVIIVRQQPIAESGDIVVALLHDEATVKRLVIRADRIELRPENRSFRPIVVAPDDELRILGKVVGVRRASESAGARRETEGHRE
ncbi:MAG: transcriptional repressor LexA [Phycisphaerae bacterium]|nr:MAG: transcriptional repressor LexA [Phycisphaerae bacterium]